MINMTKMNYLKLKNEMFFRTAKMLENVGVLEEIGVRKHGEE